MLLQGHGPYLTHPFSKNAELRPFGYPPFIRDDAHINEMRVEKSLEISVEALQYHINSKNCYNFSQYRYCHSKLDTVTLNFVSCDL